MTRAQLLAFEATDPKGVTQDYFVLPWPEALFKQFTTWYRSRPGLPLEYSLPTRSLAALLGRIDPRIIYVSSNPASPYWIIATAPPSAGLIRLCLAVWATLEVTPHRRGFDWEPILGEEPFAFYEEALSLLDFAQCSNGTADPSAFAFEVLPTFLAHAIVTKQLELQGNQRELMLGPNQRSSRSAVVAPFTKITDGQSNGLWTSKITCFTRNVPEYPLPRIHAELSVSRFMLDPVSYVPARGKDGASATVWLHAKEGFAGTGEKNVYLAAEALKPRRTGFNGWEWDGHLAEVLANTTLLPFPDPTALFAEPEPFTSEDNDIQAFILYNEGTRGEVADIEEEINEVPDSNGSGNRAKTATHPANAGFQPIDHAEVQEQLISIFEPYGIVPIQPKTLWKPPGRAKILRPREPEDQQYTIKVHSRSEYTRAALIDAVALGKGLTKCDTSSSPDSLVFKGDYTLTLEFQQPTDLATGIKRPTKDDEETVADRKRKRKDEIARILSTPPGTVAASLVEIDKPATYNSRKQIDPYDLIHIGGAIGGQVPQCLHPFKPRKPTKNRPNFPGSDFSVGHINRAIRAVDDALRQHGRLGRLDPPPGIDGDFELAALTVFQSQQGKIPAALRIDQDGQALVHLATSPNPIPYIEAPQALALGEGRLRGYKEHVVDRLIAEFLINTTGIDRGASGANRLVFVSAATFRNKWWQWLQDQRITTNHLVAPGVNLRKADPDTITRFTSQDLPGLRVIRLRDRYKGLEVPRAYGLKPDDDLGRVSGLVPYTDTVFYGINTRPDSNQTPTKLSKHDTAKPDNATKQGWNANPLEITTAFLQPRDNAAEWAYYSHQLRRAYLHTEIPTILPAPAHLLKLLGAYAM